MARYFTTKYGVPLYGNLGSAIRRTYAFAQVVDFSKVYIQVESLSEFGNKFVVIRTKQGAAEDPSAGVAVLSGSLDSPLISTFDEGTEVAISPGMNYYTVFIFDNDDAWKKDAATSVLVPEDKSTVQFLINTLPGFYTSDDHNPIDPAVYDSDLARFLYGFALTSDELSTHVDLMLPENRVNNSLRRLHGALSRGVGMPDEYTIGTVSNYRLFRESGFIYRNKGTLRGIATYVEALTGWQTLVTDSSNKLLSLDDASFESTTGHWSVTGASLEVTATNGTTIVAPTETFDSVDFPFSSGGVGEVTMTSATAVLTLPDDSSRLKSIPVDESTDYRFRAMATTASSGVAGTLSVTWLDEQGTSLSTSSSSPEGIGSSWTEVADVFSSPADARFAVLRISLSGSSTNVVYLDHVSFSESSSSDYEDPRQVKIICQPVRVNLLQDPSFDYETTSWTATSGTGSPSLEQVFNGARSAKISGTPFEFTSPSFPVVPRLPYSMLAHGYIDSGTLVAEVRWYDSSGSLIETDSDDFLDTTGEWTALSMSLVSPEGADTAVVSFTGSGISYVDAVAFEQTDRYQNFFSGIIGDVYGDDTLWSGSDQNSYSLLYPNRTIKMSRMKQTLQAYLPVDVGYRVLFWDSQDPEVQALLPYGA